jgi:hypothetical protein
MNLLQETAGNTRTLCWKPNRIKGCEKCKIVTLFASSPIFCLRALVTEVKHGLRNKNEVAAVLGCCNSGVACSFGLVRRSA